MSPPAPWRIAENNPVLSVVIPNASAIVGISTKNPSAYICWKPWPATITPAIRFGFSSPATGSDAVSEVAKSLFLRY
jgi:hypothetical protein